MKKLSFSLPVTFISFLLLAVPALACSISTSPSYVPANTDTPVTFNITNITSPNTLAGDLYLDPDANVFVGDATGPSNCSFGSSPYDATIFNCTSAFNSISFTRTVNESANNIFKFSNVTHPSEVCSDNLDISPVPVIPLSDATINEGDTFTANVSFTDPNFNATSWTATVDYGDGSGVQPLTLSGMNFSLNHQYKNEGISTITVSVTDNLGGTGTDTAAINVRDVHPSVGAITVTGSPAQGNNATTASASYTDPGVLDTHTARWNWGDGNITTGTVTEANGSGSVSNTHTYSTIGVYTVTLTITDTCDEFGGCGFGGGPSGTATVTVSVPLNAPPTVNSISNATINEGDTYTANGSFTDSDSTSWTATVDYGDGSGTQTLTLSGTNFSLNHVYQDNGTYTMTVNVTDNQGATGTETATITVNNVAPTVGTITVSTNPVQVNTATTASASYTDPGVLDTHTASWNWGDGNTTTGTVTESNGSGSVSDSHTFTAAGVYTVTLTVTDKDGGVGTQTFQYVSVYNPTSQGLFSAGQHFSSPAGAYPQNTSLTGTVKFGLSYKYQGTMPVGDKQLTMNFNAANLTFNATTISSLVIANGIGTLTGTGTLNGSGTYTFLVTGSESANTIRIQITDSSNTVIYDTQPGDAATATPTTSVTGHVLAH